MTKKKRYYMNKNTLALYKRVYYYKDRILLYPLEKGQRELRFYQGKTDEFYNDFVLIEEEELIELLFR